MRRTIWLLSTMVIAMSSVSVFAQTGNPPPPDRQDDEMRRPQDRTDDTRSSPEMTAAQRTWYAPATRWQKSSDIIGKTVKNAQGERLGEVGNLVVDPTTGRVSYAVLELGGFLGIGEKYFAVPWSAVRLSSDYSHIVYNADKSRLDASRGFGKSDKWPNFADARWSSDTYRHYGVTPWWDERSEDEAFRPSTHWQKASDLTGKKVQSRSGEELGEVNDLVIDPDNGRIIYSVIDFGSWMPGNDVNAIPWRSARLSEGYTHFVLDMDKETLKNAPHFPKDKWPNFAERRWSEDAHAFYKVPPYWVSSTRTINRGNADNRTNPVNPPRQPDKD